MSLDTGILGIGNKDLCFQVVDIITSSMTNPEIDALLPFSGAVVRLGNDAYFRGEGVPLTPVLLYYMDFYGADDTLCELNYDFHYKKYCMINGNPFIIYLCPEDNGLYSFVKFNDKDGTHKCVKKVRYLDELQEIIFQIYGKELPIRLNEVFHAKTYEPLIPIMAKDITDALEVTSYLSHSQIYQLLSERAPVFDNDVRAVIRYGIAQSLFRLEPSVYGVLIVKVN